MAIAVYFILVEPASSENVGACARALKNMGFRHLRLVNPCDHLNERAFSLAHGSHDVLRRARLFPDLAHALRGMDFCVATTSKQRSNRKDSYNCSQLLDLIKAKASAIRKIAIVFGRERYGLFSAEVDLCDIISRIPQNGHYPSLNLAQAVMVYAYALSPLSIDSIPRAGRTAGVGQYQALKRKIGLFLTRIGIDSSDQRHRRILERIAAMNATDMHLVHSVLNAWDCRRLEHGS